MYLWGCMNKSKVLNLPLRNLKSLFLKRWRQEQKLVSAWARNCSRWKFYTCCCFLPTLRTFFLKTDITFNFFRWKLRTFRLMPYHWGTALENRERTFYVLQKIFNCKSCLLSLLSFNMLIKKPCIAFYMVYYVLLSFHVSEFCLSKANDWKWLQPLL